MTTHAPIPPSLQLLFPPTHRRLVDTDGLDRAVFTLDTLQTGEVLVVVTPAQCRPHGGGPVGREGALLLTSEHLPDNDSVRPRLAVTLSHRREGHQVPARGDVRSGGGQRSTVEYSSQSDVGSGYSQTRPEHDSDQRRVRDENYTATEQSHRGGVHH